MWAGRLAHPYVLRCESNSGLRAHLLQVFTAFARTHGAIAPMRGEFARFKTLQAADAAVYRRPANV
jgi:hypothetical protein